MARQKNKSLRSPLLCHATLYNGNTVLLVKSIPFWAMKFNRELKRRITNPTACVVYCIILSLMQILPLHSVLQNKTTYVSKKIIATMLYLILILTTCLYRVALKLINVMNACHNYRDLGTKYLPYFNNSFNTPAFVATALK